MSRFFFGFNPVLSMLLAASTWLVFASSAAAVPVSFDCITDNNLDSCATGESQLLLDITDEGSNQIRFTFTNGDSDSVISEIYFDDGALLGVSEIINSDGVDFSEGARPPILPGGDLASPTFDVSFSASANNPAPRNGVGEGESVAIIFELIGGFDFDDAIAQFADGTVRAGLHVISFAEGGSESFVNVVPEPGTAWMMFAGLVILSSHARKQS